MRVLPSLFLVLFVYSSFVGATQPKGPECELEMSHGARALVNVVRGSLERRDIDPTDVLQFLNSPGAETSSPYSANPKGLYTLNGANTFLRYFLQLKPSEQAKVRTALSALVEGENGKGKIVEQAREETQFVFKPHLRRLSSKFEIGPNLGGYTRGEWNGRPVFVGRFTHADSENLLYVLFDPLNSNPDDQVVQLGESQFSGTRVSASIFTLNGKTYAFFFDEYIIFELESRKQVSLSEFGLERWKSLSPNQYLILPTPEGPIAYVSSYQPQGLFEVNLSQPNLKPKPLHTGAIADLRHSAVGGRRYVIFTASVNEETKDVYIFEPGTEPKKVSSFQAGRLADLLMYADQGQTFIATLYFKDRNERAQRLVRVNIESMASVQLYEMYETEALHLLDRDEVPNFYSTEGGQITLGSLRTPELEGIQNLVPGVKHSLGTFTWDGRHYFAWLQERSKIHIQELSSATHIEIDNSGHTADEMFHFNDQRGRPMALVRTAKGTPFVLEFTNPSLRGRR